MRVGTIVSFKHQMGWFAMTGMAAPGTSFFRLVREGNLPHSHNERDGRHFL